MKIIVLHGDDFEKLEKRRQSLIKEAKASKLDFSVFAPELNSFAEQVSRRGLFGSEGLFICDETSKVPVKEIKWVLDHTQAIKGTLVFINHGFLNKTVEKLLPAQAEVDVFKLPRLIYSFLDSVYPGNSAKALGFYHRLATSEPPEYLIHMLGRHLRDLYWAAKSPSTLPYKEDWRILKLTAQAKRFKKGQLEKLIGELAKIDIAIKTSSDSLSGLLDQLILTQLE